MDKLTVIARIRCDFHTNFGIPRQSGLADTRATVVFEPQFRVREALRGIDGYSHIWLIWGFSQLKHDGWTPTVRPPRLGGNKRMGVFATRSPYRPNPIGLSCVKLIGIEDDKKYGQVLIVSGADLMDGTPIYDIKPYLPFTDSVPDAVGGFADEVKNHRLEVIIPDIYSEMLPQDIVSALHDILSGDIRPSYHDAEDRIYGLDYADYNIKFTVRDGVLTVTDIKKHL